MKLPYFKLGDAFDNIKDQFSYVNTLDKAGSIAKLSGKTVANVGLLAVDAVVAASAELVKKGPEYYGRSAEETLRRNNNLTEDQRNKLNEIAEEGIKHKKDREIEEERQKVEQKKEAERKAYIEKNK